MRAGARCLLLAALLAPAAARAGEVPDPGQWQRLTQADDGRRLTLPVGAVLRVALDANPSTGADWQRRDGFGGVLRSVPCEGERRRPLVVAGEPAPPVGTSVDVAYCFQAVAPGKAYLTLAYGRVWQAEAPPWRSFRLEIDVVPAP
mgnify:CR=1 FL=1